MNRMKYNMGGMTYGDGLKSNKNTPKGVGMVDYFAEQGIEMVEDTLDYSMKRGTIIIFFSCKENKIINRVWNSICKKFHYELPSSRFKYSLE